MRILAATGNKHKLAELRAVAARFPIELLAPAEVGCGDAPDVEETGETYRDNALLKAEAYGRWAGLPALADDSGLEVLALGGEPGVHSARYLGPEASDSDRMESIIRRLEASGTDDRRARYHCHLVLWRPDFPVLEATADLEGQVLRELRGEGGFGYDPLILINEISKTLAEVPFSWTCEHGFRARAARTLFEKLF